MAISQTNRGLDRRDLDRRQNSHPVSVDRRGTDRRAEADRRAGSTAGRPEGTARSTTASGATASTTTADVHRGSDSTSVSPDAEQSEHGGEDNEAGMGSFLQSFQGNYQNGSGSATMNAVGSGQPLSGSAGVANVDAKGQVETKGKGEFSSFAGAASATGSVKMSSTPAASRPVNETAKPDAAKADAPKPSPEEERRDMLEQTGKTLQSYSEFTTGEDGLTSRDDYQAIADGKRDEDFTKFLKDKHPNWSEEQVSSELESLQESSRNLVKDQGAFDLYDNATDGGDKDQNISAEDLASGRLRNDTSKDFPPKLSVDQINELHEVNPALGNEAITNKYYHQSQELNKLMGGDDKNFLATWPAYGSQASNSAGVMIRDDGVPGSDSMSEQVEAGNRKVFADIAPRYDRYIEAAKQPGFNYDEWAKDEFGDRPKGVEPLMEASKKPGFDAGKWDQSLPEEYKENPGYLRESFDFMDAARGNKDNPDKQQEQLLASNVLAGRHEQQRLQPEIEGATAPITGSAFEREAIELAVDKDPTFYSPNGKGSGPADEYKVDQKLNASAPDALKDITDPAVRAALTIGLGQGDTPGSMRGDDLINATGTENWADLDGRMRTIAGLMVAGQNSPTMGEYILDYDQPAALGTGTNAIDVGKNILEKGGNALESATGTLGDVGKNAWETATGVLGGLF